jgi:GR25 family glycosyltransferase involved in LPS biosynthesis
MYNYGRRRYIIFEDDFAIPVNMIEEIEILIKRIPEDWDIILLHHYISKFKQENGYRIVQRFQSMAAYMISNKGAKKMFESGLLFPMTQQIDAFLSEMSSVVNIYASLKSISHAGGSMTDIQVEIGGDKQWNRYLLNHGT